MMIKVFKNITFILSTFDIISILYEWNIWDPQKWDASNEA